MANEQEKQATETKEPAKKASSSSERKAKVGDHVWYRDYSGLLLAIVSDVKHGSSKYVNLSVLTRAGTWLSRQDAPRHDASQFAFPVEGSWDFERTDLE